MNNAHFPKEPLRYKFDRVMFWSAVAAFVAIYIFWWIGFPAWSQTPGASCTYRGTADVLISMCTLSDGSGVETFMSDTGVSEDDYTPAQWTKRLTDVATVEAEYAAKMKVITDEIRLSTAADSITAKKPCLAAGFKWHRDGLFHGWCSTDYFRGK